MQRIAARIDQFLFWLKWPLAIAAVVFLPGAAIAIVRLIWTIAWDLPPLFPFLIGLCGYLVLWWVVFRRPITGSYFSTLEHELTHALFAVVTFHRVTGLRATWRRGGRMSFVGRGNWLISISPYFFPTLCVLILLLALPLPASLSNWTDALMGAALAYHVTSTIRETHIGQSDLRNVGILFSLMFLPFANIVAAGTVVSFSHGGTGALLAFWATLI